jgi:4-aminobutyrate aminotransferase-like enzyme
MRTQERDEQYLGRDGEPDDLEVAHAQGSYLIDARGKRMVDFVMGWCVGNLGWGHADIRKAVKGFDGPDYVLPRLLYKPWADLAELLEELTPGKLKRSFRATGGTEAVEIALQAALAHTGRSAFVSLEGCYHGNSIAAKSLDEAVSRARMPNRLAHCRRLKPPLDRQGAERLATMLKSKDVAAFIMEPIVMALGVVAPEPEFMQRAQELCRKYGTLFVMDEVATGFGRTGKLFASEHYDLEPDILILAKALTGGYGAMGATVMTEKVAKTMPEEGFHSTYGWHPRSVAAALANVKHWKRHRDALLGNADRMGRYFASRLASLKWPMRPEIRVQGLALAVAFPSAGYVERYAARALEQGVLIATHDACTFLLFPALTIDEPTAEAGLKRMEAAV